MPSETKTCSSERDARVIATDLSIRLYRDYRQLTMDRADSDFELINPIGFRGTDDSCAAPSRGNGTGAELDNGRVIECADEGSGYLDHRPTKGTFLDETIDLSDPEGASLTSVVMEVIANQRSSGRTRQERYTDYERALVRCMLANGLRCEWHRQPPVVSYLRKADGYSDKQNKPVWLSGPALSRTADLLAGAGLIRLLPGERDTASGFTVTSELLALGEKHGVSIRSLRRSLQREDLVRLKAHRPKATWDVFMRKLVRHKGDRIYFNSIPQTEEWRDSLGAFNDYIACQNIDVQLPEQLVRQWTDDLNNSEDHSGQDIYRPELFRNAAYRVFNDGLAENPSFERGGRLAGCWWMNAPREVRPYITLNGEPTVELDFRCCHPRMLYHERGLDNSGDLYHIPEIADLERNACLEPETYRKGVKWVFQFLINGKRRPNINECPPDVTLPPGMTPAELAKIIEWEHQPITDAFRTGAGLRLMRIESDIALAVINRAREEGVVALPVHDSFISNNYHEEKLKVNMKEEYIKLLGHTPVIKKASSTYY